MDDRTLAGAMTGGESGDDVRAGYGDRTMIINLLPHAYVEFVRYHGADTTSPELLREEMRGNVFVQIEETEALADMNILKPMVIGGVRHDLYPHYPLDALKQYIRNAVMHRDYELHAPIKVQWFDERIEVVSPGGVCGFGGKHLPEHFTSYRNPFLTASLKAADVVKGFGLGIPLAEKVMKDNGNPPPEYDIDGGHFRVVLRPAKLTAAREH